MQLAIGIHFAQVGDRGVVMDFARGRYIAVGRKMTNLVLSNISDTSYEIQNSINRSSALDVLKKANAVGPDTVWSYVQPHERSEVLPVEFQLGRPTFGLGIGQTAGLTFSVLRSLVLVQRSLISRPFDGTLKWLEARKSTDLARKPRHCVQELLDAYYAARPWYTVAPICRLDALSLVRFLRIYGHPAELKFGVRLDPFYAHCWVQLADTSLNEPHEQLRQYTIIRSV